jgi:hypothetical protein
MDSTLDQIEYIKDIKPIVHEDLKGPAESACSVSLQALYMSLVGAVAWAMLTRVDMCIYCVACQRRTQTAQLIHVRRLNAIVRHMQRNPMRLRYRRQRGHTMLRIVSDSAFKREDESGHAIKGALFLRVATKHSQAETNTRGAISQATDIWCPGELMTVHVLDFTVRKQRHVTRSTFGAELFAACDAADQGMLIATLIHQIRTGACSVTIARDLREHGGWAVQMVLAIDAYRVFAAVTAQMVKTPAEVSLLSHIQYLRELLDKGILTHLSWLDTRDMIADGLTKGSIDRKDVRTVMEGRWTIIQKAVSWRSKVAARKEMLAETRKE